MNLGTIRPALLTLLGQISGLHTDWEDKQRPFVPENTRTILLLKIRPILSKGVDDLRVNQDLTKPNGTEMGFEVHGVRLFTLGCKVECYEQWDDGDAWQYLETIRNRLQFPTSLAALLNVNVALVELGSVVDLGQPRDNHIVSIANLDVRLCAGAQETDPTRVGYINNVRVTGKNVISETDGTP